MFEIQVWDLLLGSCLGFGFGIQVWDSNPAFRFGIQARDSGLGLRIAI